MPQLLKFVDSINLAGIVHLRVYAHNCGNVDNGAEAEALPYIRAGEDGTEPSGVHHEVHFFHTKLGDQGVDDSVCRGQKIDNHACNNDGGDKVRKIRYGLGKSLEGSILDLNDTDSEQDGDGESE